MSLYIATIKVNEDVAPNKNGDVFVNGFPCITSIRKMTWIDKILSILKLVKYPKFGNNSELPENIDDAEMLIEVPGPAMKLLHGTDGKYTKVCTCITPQKLREDVKARDLLV